MRPVLIYALIIALLVWLDVTFNGSHFTSAIYLELQEFVREVTRIATHGF